MTQKNISTIQRAIGVLEGVAFGVSNDAANAIELAIERIESAIREDAEKALENQ